MWFTKQTLRNHCIYAVKLQLNWYYTMYSNLAAYLNNVCFPSVSNLFMYNCKIFKLFFLWRETKNQKDIMRLMLMR